eukprot:3586450-Pyramimonas_sp.AAC.1
MLLLPASAGPLPFCSSLHECHDPAKPTHTYIYGRAEAGVSKETRDERSGLVWNPGSMSSSLAPRKAGLMESTR